jgi:thioredoxin 1
MISAHLPEIRGPTGPARTAPRAFTMSNAVEVTDSQWDQSVLQSDVPVFVDFWAEWCAPCRAMGPYVDKLAGDYRGKLKVLKMNTSDNPEVPARYGVTAIPTFLIIKKGEVVKQLVGSQPYDQLKKSVEAYL